jgi:hypothetical protein
MFKNCSPQYIIQIVEKFNKLPFLLVWNTNFETSKVDVEKTNIAPAALIKTGVMTSDLSSVITFINVSLIL